jgi:hypothetical protein
VRSLKGIQRRIQRLASSAEPPDAPVADQAAEVLRHWRETGELLDGGRISLAVYRQIVVLEELECQTAQTQAELLQDRGPEVIR